MAMVKCSDCGKQVSTKAKACPECGAPPPKKKIGCLAGCLLLLILGLFIMIAIGLFAEKRSSSPEAILSSRTSPKSVQPKPATAVKKKKSKVRLSLEKVFPADSIIKIKTNKMGKDKYWVLVDYQVKDDASRSEVIKDAMSIIKLWSTDPKYKKIDRYVLWGHDDSDEFSYMLSKFLLDASVARRIKWDKIPQEKFLDIVKKHGELFVHPSLK